MAVRPRALATVSCASATGDGVATASPVAGSWPPTRPHPDAEGVEVACVLDARLAVAAGDAVRPHRPRLWRDGPTASLLAGAKETGVVDAAGRHIQTPALRPEVAVGARPLSRVHALALAVATLCQSARSRLADDVLALPRLAPLLLDTVAWPVPLAVEEGVAAAGGDAGAVRRAGGAVAGGVARGDASR